MEWSKAKNLILLILVLTNVLLLFFVAGPKTQSAIQNDRARDTAIKLLHAQGIAVNDALIPTELTLSQLNFTQDRSREEHLATALLGTVTPEDLGGGIMLYTGAEGAIRFHTSGEFSAEFLPESKSIGTATPQEYSLDLLDTLELEGEIYDVTLENDTTIIQIGQLWDGVPLQGYGLSLHYSNNTLTSITAGKRLAGTTTTSDFPTITIPTALMNFATGIQTLGDVTQLIEQIRPAYIVSPSPSDTVELIPIWYIGTDTSAYHLDLISGKLSRSTL